MKYLTGVALAIVLLGSLAAGSAWGHDLNPPTWRGTENTTFQEWTFDTDASPVGPENPGNPYGGSTATITVGNGGTGWQHQLEMMGSQQGYWDLGQSGTIELNIPNRPNVDPLHSSKLIRVQVTYYVGMVEPPFVSVLPNGASLVDSGSVPVEFAPPFGDWISYWSDWLLPFNPDTETITITGDPLMGSVIDQITVDTQCIGAPVPEPASIVTLLIGGLGVLVARRRRS